MSEPKWRVGERVLVKVCGRNDEWPLDPPVLGTITRKLIRDDSAWVALDVRVLDEAHPFSADDSRGTHVLAWPENCEAWTEAWPSSGLAPRSLGWPGGAR